MDDQKVNMIAAIGRRGQIGLDGALPWHSAADLALFQQQTNGSAIVMGGRTLDELAKVSGSRQPLPGRVVYSYRRHNTPDELFGLIAMDRPGWPVWIAGGAHVYRVFAPFVTGLRILSLIDYDGEADAWFPFDAYGMAVLEAAA